MHMHHGGTFQRYPQVKYIGMKVDVWDNRDPDFISYFELVDMVKELGYEKVSRIWYRVPNMNASESIREIKKGS